MRVNRADQNWDMFRGTGGQVIPKKRSTIAKPHCPESPAPRPFLYVKLQRGEVTVHSSSLDLTATPAWSYLPGHCPNWKEARADETFCVWDEEREMEVGHSA